MQKIQGNIQIEKYPDGTMAIILLKLLVEKFDEVFGKKPIDVFVGVAKKEKRIVIEITLPKQTYIA